MPGDSVLPVDADEALEELLQELPEHTPFLDSLRERGHPADLLLLGAVPVVLVGVFELPLETRRDWAFAYGDPTVWTALAANYVHLTEPHLISNLVAFAAVAPLGYLLALATDHRKRFLGALAVVLLVLPVPLSYLNLAVPRPGGTVGFSGLNMALFGFAVVAFAAYVDEHFTDHFGVENAPALFFLVTAFVGAPHVARQAGYAVVAGSVGLAALYSLGFWASYRPDVSGLSEAVDKQGYVELLVVAALVLAAVVPMAFPQDPYTESGVLNVYTHLLGFAAGFVGTYAWVLLGTSADPERALPVGA